MKIFKRKNFFVAEKAATIRKLPCLSLLHVCERKRERESKKERVNVRVFERQTSRMCVCMSERKRKREHLFLLWIPLQHACTTQRHKESLGNTISSLPHTLSLMGFSLKRGRERKEGAIQGPDVSKVSNEI